MQSVTLQTTKETSYWNQSLVIEQRVRLRRGTPLSNTTNVDAVVARVVSNARLDHAMRCQLVRVLTATLKDWAQK